MPEGYDPSFAPPDAVPVRRADREVVAALGIVVPSLERHRPRLVAALQVAAHGIGRGLTGPSGRG